MTPVQHASDRGELADRILAAVYADQGFMRGVREAMRQMDEGRPPTHYRDLKRKKNARA